MSKHPNMKIKHKFGVAPLRILLAFAFTPAYVAGQLSRARPKLLAFTVPRPYAKMTISNSVLQFRFLPYDTQPIATPTMTLSKSSS